MNIITIKFGTELKPTQNSCKSQFHLEHGYSLVIPPHFDGNNYAYWKVRMKAFLKSIDERVWLFVENGWERPTTAISEWTTAQNEAASFNSKAMNAIFNAISMEEFKRISNVEVAQTAWNIPPYCA